MKRLIQRVWYAGAGEVLGFMAVVVVGATFAVLGAPAKEAEAQIPASTQATLWTCSLDDIGATLTKCVLTPAPISDTTLSTYVTTVIGESTTATAGLFLLRYGTGTNCGTGTTSVFPSAATVPRIQYPGNAANPTVIALTTPLKVPPGKDLCLIGSATNTFTGQISGFYGAP